jgi:hypothetical protein
MEAKRNRIMSHFRGLDFKMDTDPHFIGYRRRPRPEKRISARGTIDFSKNGQSDELEDEGGECQQNHPDSNQLRESQG